MKTLQNSSTQKSSTIFSFNSDLELQEASTCQDFFRMEILRKVAQLFWPIAMKDKWLFKQMCARASSVRKKHANNHGCLGWDQLEARPPPGHLHKAPVWLLLDSSKGPVRTEAKMAQVVTLERLLLTSISFLPATASFIIDTIKEFPLFMLVPIIAVQLLSCQAEFCTQAWQSPSYFYVS